MRTSGCPANEKIRRTNRKKIVLKWSSLHAEIAYRHGVVIRIFPNGHINETRSIVVAISQSASSFNFSLTVKANKPVESNLITWSQLTVSSFTLTQSTSIVDRFDALVFHALHQLRRCQFFDQISCYDETAIVVGAPGYRYSVYNRRR